MADVTTREKDKRFEVLLDGEVLHQASSNAEARAVAQWVSFQLHAGTGEADLERMLKGQAPKKASGFSGGLVIASDEPPAKKSKAKPAKKAKASKKASGPDLSVLDGRVNKVKKAIESGDQDEWLADLKEAEEGGKARTTVLGAIESRMEEIA